MNEDYDDALLRFHDYPLLIHSYIFNNVVLNVQLDLLFLLNFYDGRDDDGVGEVRYLQNPFFLALISDHLINFIIHHLDIAFYDTLLIVFPFFLIFNSVLIHPVIKFVVNQ